MKKQLIHLWGPFSIQSYGLLIVIGILISTWLFLRNPRRMSILSKDQFNKLLMVAIISAIVGGRILYVMENNDIGNVADIFKIWEGGFSLLGSIIAILIALPLYLKYIRVPVIPFFDLAAIYAPLLQSIARIGCFFAGCCYGVETNVPWAIVYKDPHSIAPLFKKMHPTQLYSSFLLFMIFLFMVFYASKRLKKPGQLICTYLAFAATERFLTDFLRADRTLLSQSGFLPHFSIHQWLALLIAVSSCITLIGIQLFPTTETGK